ncbi:MAG: ABC transporter permease [Erysipelotrichaceae bacterium]|nr:ABC transporter permease [Erysipelotrichaceae bacterium]
MKHLIKFSLVRRFNNRSTIILNLLMIMLVGGVFFADKILLLINPDFLKPITIFLDAPLYEQLADFPEDITLYYLEEDQGEKINKNEFRLSFSEAKGWVVTSQYAIDDLTSQKIDYLVRQFQQNNWAADKDPQLLNDLQEVMNPQISNEVISSAPEIDSAKQNLLFMVITSIYFMMLGFSSVIANEVVYEKTSKILELILTSVSARTHFISKMLIGWLTISIQAVLTGLILAGWFMIRQHFDRGTGLLTFFAQLKVLPFEALTFKELFVMLNIDRRILFSFLIVIAFLLMGILFLQMIMVIVSSFVISIEESSNVQAPCYLILLAIYYFTLSVNTPYQMSEGIGYYLSFVPFFSMLFMPCRLLIQSVPAYELFISLFTALLAIILTVDFGCHFYKQGILDNKPGKNLSKKKVTG